MTLRKSFAIAATTFAIASSASAFAQSGEVRAYHYGMDIDQMISVQAPANPQGHSSTATLTYRDSNGQVHQVSYSQPNTLANQN